METPLAHGNVLAIDIGNTRTHIAIVDKSALKSLARIDISTNDSSRLVLQSVNSLHEQVNLDSTSAVVISSVVKSALAKTMLLFEKENIAVKQFRYTEKFPLKINYDNPGGLGTDRMANALYGYAGFPGENLILIGAGTALTVDLLCGQQFLGGAILAGPSMQFHSLKNFTDALPETDANGKCRLPGTSTEECVRAGVLYGIGGALNNIVCRYNQLLKGKPGILVTGGAWPLLRDFIDFEHFFIPDMTLLGISLFSDIE